MRIAYLILAHDNHRHLHRLVQRLTSDDVSFYVHIDKKSDIKLFNDFEHPSVNFCMDRIDCAWADISLVDATLALIRLALKGEAKHDYFVLLSGACYPLQPNNYIHAYLASNRGAEFIEAFPFPDVNHGKPAERMTCFWIRKSPPFKSLKWQVQHLLNAMAPARDYAKGLHSAAPAVGSQWWALSYDAVKYITNFVDENPEFYRFCKHIDCPDELVFQTILWNSPLKNNISHSLTFTHWEQHKISPEVIDSSYLPMFRKPVIFDSKQNNCPNEKREVLFGRKFSDTTSEVVDLLDDVILSKSTHAVDLPTLR